MIIYALLLTVSIYSSFYPIFKAIDAESDGIAYAIVKAVISILPYMIPMFIFSTMYGMYALCINGCKKNFGYSDAMLSEYLGDESVFKPISKDGTILASEKAIYYKNLYCIIPFDQITSVEKINILIEQDVYFHLNNGKKIEIASKQYDCVKEAFDSYKATV